MRTSREKVISSRENEGNVTMFHAQNISNVARQQTNSIRVSTHKINPLKKDRKMRVV